MPKKKLRPERLIDIPLEEVSGICVDRSHKGRVSLLAVGDCLAVGARLSLADPDGDELTWELTPIARLAGTRLPRRNPQVEAIAVDGAGRVLLLQESPARAEFVDLVTARVVASFELEVPDDGPVGTSWTDPDGSRGEGVLLLAGGHLLVAKEKKPAAFIEFGPPGARSRGVAGRLVPAGRRWPVTAGEHRYVALAIWRPDDALKKACKDFSDLSVGPDGHVYVLSDQSEAIARVSALAPGGGTATLDASWKISGVKGKPEGLAFTKDGRAVVALDTRKKRRNLVVLAPAIAAH
jgi:hypothetical protein